MAVLFHVNGSALIYVGQGTGGSQLGYSSAEGVKVETLVGQEMVYSDQLGPFVPGEVLNNGTIAQITFDLYKYDNSVLAALNAKREGGNLGQFTAAGTLMFLNELTSGITIASPIDGLNYYFPRAWLAGDPQPVQLSTQLKIWGLKFMAAPNSQNVLYQFV